MRHHAAHYTPLDRETLDARGVFEAQFINNHPTKVHVGAIDAEHLIRYHDVRKAIFHKVSARLLAGYLIACTVAYTEVLATEGEEFLLQRI